MFHYMMRNAAVAVAICASISSAHAQEASTSLYPGEQKVEAAGRPAVIRFVEGEADKPLLVFVPGTNHMARIAYGGHEGSREEDFLAHWVTRRGYNFLGVSYPIDTNSDVFDEPQPDFTIREWGQQAMELARRTIEENGLANRVIVLGWSMGGKISQSVFDAAQEQDVNLDFYISFVATPPVPGLINLDRTFEMLDTGYADRRMNRAGWFDQVAANSEEAGHEIVPEDVFMNEYTGDISVNLEGYKQRYRDGAFVEDRLEGMADSKGFHFDAFPLVAMILNDGRADRRHAVTDQAAWSFYNANTIYRRYIGGNEVDVNALSDSNWQGVIDLTRSAPDRLSATVSGNHFFFVGEDGARATARAIVDLEEKVHAFRSELSTLLGTEIR